MLPEPPSFGTLVTVWVRRIYGSERGDTTTRESRIKREIGGEIHEGHKETQSVIRHNGESRNPEFSSTFFHYPSDSARSETPLQSSTIVWILAL